jgi:MerR family transcriptional regulator, thiopeptide resistance regulator
MVDSLDIAEVARRTGVSSRTLRFYEARGLLRPLRTASGRRHYGAGELERIHQILMLKRAGLSIAQIERLTRQNQINLADLIETQLSILGKQASAIHDRRNLLFSIKSRIDRAEPIDIATFCSLIQSGETMMAQETRAWDVLANRYMSQQALEDYTKVQPELAHTFETADYSAQWKKLGDRIKAALPMDPTSEQALGFVREWFALLAPFTAVATPAMWEGSRAMYDDMGEWQGKSDADPGFDAEVWNFIRAATISAQSKGQDIGPVPAFMQQ